MTEAPINLEQIAAQRDIIGNAFQSTTNVYKTQFPGRSQDVALMWELVDPQSIKTLEMKAQANNYVGNHPNLLGILQNSFVGGHYYVAFPLMECSLRSLLTGRFYDGLPENYILTALRETVKGLFALHQMGCTHGAISAGHIMFDEAEIKLGYSATVFDLDQDLVEGTPLSLNMDNVCYWASAPERYEKLNMPGDCKQAGDMWQIGVTALELAYGRLNFARRDDFSEFVLKIHHEKRLPDRQEFIEQQWKKRHIRVFSEEFERMVIWCLSLKPEERPTADQFLKSPVFHEKTCKKVADFYSLWLKNKPVNKRGEIGWYPIEGIRPEFIVNLRVQK